MLFEDDLDTGGSGILGQEGRKVIAEGEVPTVHMLPPEAQVFDESAASWCVYFLLDEEEVVYVGKSRKLAVRIQQHRSGVGVPTKKRFTSVRFVSIASAAQAASEERRWIGRLRPKYNAWEDYRPADSISNGRLCCDIGKDLHDRLVALADLNGRTVTQQLIILMEKGIAAERKT